MAEKELSILVRAKNVAQAVKDIGKVNTSIGNLGNTAKQGVLNVGANLAKIGLIAAGGVGAGVIAGVKSLEELERVTNATEGVIKSTGAAAGVTAAQVRDLAQSLEGVTTVDDKVIQGSENLLLTFTGIGKDIFPQATKAMTDMAIAMAQGDVEAVDLKATAIQLGKALQDPVRGATTLRRVGVQLTDQQEEQIKTFVKSGDTLSAQKIILAELEKEFGKAGEAAGKGFGADIRRVKDAVEDAEQALAVGFLPIIRKVADWLKTKLADKGTLAAIRDFGTKLAGGFDKMLTVVSRIPWGTIGDGLKTAGQWAGKLFDAFLSMPPQVQSTIIALAGLNKLSGGAIGGIVGELGKGLIKGVLGMTAGVVNINAGVVKGGSLGPLDGPGAATGGGGSVAGTLARMAAGTVPVLLVASSVAAVAAGIGEVINEATRNDPVLTQNRENRIRTTGGTQLPGGRGGSLGPNARANFPTGLSTSDRSAIVNSSRNSLLAAQAALASSRNSYLAKQAAPVVNVTVNTNVTANAVSAAQRQTFRVGNTARVQS